MQTSRDDEQYKQAIITSLRLLAASPKCCAELRKKLEDKGYPGPLIDQVLAELKSQGILDDTVYARDLVARLTQLKAEGKFKVAFELKRRGISSNIRQELLDTMTLETELTRALEQARIKWLGWQKLDRSKRKKRVYDFLIRKGYDFQIVHEVLTQLDKGPCNDED